MTIEVRRLGRRFGDFALDRVSLRMEKGEYWVLLGPSGCGKSLLLETIAGLFAPDSGSVVVDGRDATGDPPERRDIGLVFQRAALFPHYSVAGNIEYGLRARGLPKPERRRRIDEMVGRMRLEPLLERPVATLSGGEAQRVAIARALAVRPVLLLLDEPLSLVDHNARLELQVELGRLHAELGLTTLHVTHSREEAVAMGDHCAVMLAGHVVQSGETRALFARPRCPSVASFLGLDASTCPEVPACAAQCHAGAGPCDDA